MTSKIKLGKKIYLVEHNMVEYGPVDSLETALISYMVRQGSRARTISSFIKYVESKYTNYYIKNIKRLK